MRANKIFLSLGVITFVLGMFLTTSLGYAYETGAMIEIVDRPAPVLEEGAFDVTFLKDVKTFGDGEISVEITGGTSALFSITGFKNIGDSATAVLTIKNNSRDFAAELEAFVENSNTEYFKTIVSFSDKLIESYNGSAVVKFMVELVKLPVFNDIDASIGINIVAKPVGAK